MVVGYILAIHNVKLNTAWIGLVFSTVSVFGVLVYIYWRDLKKLRCLIVFCLLLFGHVELILWGLRHGVEIPILYYGFIGIPEFGLVAIVLILVGGASKGPPPGRRHRHRPNGDGV